MRKRKELNSDTLVVGGLHKDDFEWACREYDGSGFVLVAFELDCDGYHWKAVYVRDLGSVDFHWEEMRGEIPDAW